MEFVEIVHPVFNFPQCIEELILNSINGCSSCIAIRVNWNTFSIQVLDNGTGIDLGVMNSIGSRPILQTDGARDKKYSTCGRTLHLINQLSGNLSIVSKPRNSDTTWEKSYQKQKMIKNLHVSSRKSCGTTITISDYLYASERLRSDLDIPLQMEKIKSLINSFVLLHSGISFSVRDDSASVHSYDIYQVKRCRNTMEAAEQLFRLKVNGKLFPFHKTSQHFRIKGLVGNQHLKNYWFVYVNNRPIESVEMNSLIASIFQSKETVQNRGLVLNIKCVRSEYRLLIKWNRTDVEFKHWNELRRQLLSSLGAIHQQISELEFKSIQIDQWLDNLQKDYAAGNHFTNEFQTSGKTPNKTATPPSIYTAIKQRSTILFNDEICKDNITVDNESIEISTKTGETDKILDTHSEKYHVTEALTPLTVIESIGCDIECSTIAELEYHLYGKLQETVNDRAIINSPAFRTCFSSTAPASGVVDLSVEELQKDWVDETDPGNFASETTQNDTFNREHLENVLELIIADNKTDEDLIKKEVPDSQNTLKKKRGPSNFGAPIPIKVQKTELENWVRISNPNDSYFCNTLSGNTCYEMPPIHRKIFELGQKSHLNQPSINFKSLQIPNEFWVNYKQPLNVSKTSSNSFPHFRAILRDCRFSKQMFETLIVIKQVDEKFICCIAEEKNRKFLILVDQHAAHERVCLEKLIQLHSKKDSNGFVRIQSSPLQPHLQLTFTLHEIDVLRKLKDKLSNFGLSLTVTNEVDIFVTHIPSCFLEREASEIRRGRNSVYDKLTVTLLKDIIAEYLESGRVGNCLLPISIRNVLNSLACHGAIKFGDRLTHKQCTQLVRALTQCEVPFQCAHGRPSITPLLDIGELAKLHNDIEPRPRYGRLISKN